MQSSPGFGSAPLVSDTVDYELTGEDIAKAWQANASGAAGLAQDRVLRKKAVRDAGLLLVAGLATGYGGLRLIALGEAIAGTIIAFLSVGVFITMLQSLVPGRHMSNVLRAIARARARGELDLHAGTYRVSLTEEGVQRTDPLYVMLYRWRVIRRVMANEHGVCVELLSDGMLVVPLHAFRDAGAAEAWAARAEMLRAGAGDGALNQIAFALAEQDVACPGCGYSLRGLQRGSCPECGWKIDLAQLSAVRDEESSST